MTTKNLVVDIGSEPVAVVHWLVNVTPRPVCDRFGLPVSTAGGWLDALREAVVHRDDVDLTISFLADEPVREFTDSDGVSYVPIHVTRNLKGPVARWRHRLTEKRVLEATARTLALVDAPLVHVHGTERVFGIAARRRPAAVVVSIQGILSVCERMYWRGLARDVGSWLRPKKLLGHTDAWTEWRLMKRRAAAEKVVLRESNAIFGRTSCDSRFARVVAPETPYFHVGEVLRSPFYSAAWDLRAAKRATLYTTVGAAPYKGLETVVEALALLNGAGYDLCLRVGGSVAHSDLWRVARRVARRMNMGGRVMLLGSLDAAAVAAELCACRVFVCGSHAENSPNSVAEALMVGAPTVATYAGGVPSLVSDGRTGLLVQDGDPWAMAGAVAELLDDADVSARLSANARAAALDRHDPARVAGELADAYAAVLGMNR